MLTLEALELFVDLLQRVSQLAGHLRIRFELGQLLLQGAGVGLERVSGRFQLAAVFLELLFMAAALVGLGFGFAAGVGLAELAALEQLAEQLLEFVDPFRLAFEPLLEVADAAFEDFDLEAQAGLVATVGERGGDRAGQQGERGAQPQRTGVLHGWVS